MSDLKGFIVNSDECSLVVFAESPGQAKSIALTQERFYCCDFVGLRARRCKTVDEFVGVITKDNWPYAPYFYNDKTIPIFRAAGIYELDEPTCDTCGLSGYGKPEYAVCPDCYTCKECLDESGCGCESQDDDD